MAKKRKITIRTVFLGICSVIIVGIGFGFLPEILGEDVKIQLQESLGENYYVIIWAFFGFVILVWLAVFFHENKEEISGETKSQIDFRSEFLKNLKQHYENRLNDKMMGELHFELKLKLKYTTKGTQPETVEDFFIITKEARTGGFDRFFKNFVKNLWRLLIIGEPGAGKSILLLRFGLNLIELAEKDHDFPIPILLDLKSWKDNNQTFQDWLEMNLPFISGSFTLSRTNAKVLAESNNLLLLLDGFDEIGEQYRNSCFKSLMVYLQKVKNSRKTSQPEVIICSRITEYEKAIDAPVFASVKIEPLTKYDVTKVLTPLVEKKNFPAAKRLNTVLKENQEWYAAITSAFFMHTLLNIAQHTRPEFEGNSKEALQREITETYIKIELDKVEKFRSNKVKRWLGWLAWNMKYLEGNVTFELVDLQPRWTKVKYIFNSIYSSLIFLIAFSVFNRSGNLLYGLSTSFFVSLLMTFGSNEIKPAELKALNLNKLSLRIILKGIVLGLIFSVINGFIFSFNSAFIFGALTGFTVGFLYFILTELTIEAQLPKVQNPYKRFISDLVMCYQT